MPGSSTSRGTVDAGGDLVVEAGQRQGAVARSSSRTPASTGTGGRLGRLRAAQATASARTSRSTRNFTAGSLVVADAATQRRARARRRGRTASRATASDRARRRTRRGPATGLPVLLGGREPVRAGRVVVVVHRPARCAVTWDMVRPDHHRVAVVDPGDETDDAQVSGAVVGRAVRLLWPGLVDRHGLDVAVGRRRPQPRATQLIPNSSPRDARCLGDPRRVRRCVCRAGLASARQTFRRSSAVRRGRRGRRRRRWRRVLGRGGPASGALSPAGVLLDAAGELGDLVVDRATLGHRARGSSCRRA